jgi:hypothetical protein
MLPCFGNAAPAPDCSPSIALRHDASGFDPDRPLPNIPESNASRGIFRREYEGATLRENVGLPRPANQFQPQS